MAIDVKQLAEAVKTGELSWESAIRVIEQRVYAAHMPHSYVSKYTSELTNRVTANSTHAEYFSGEHSQRRPFVEIVNQQRWLNERQKYSPNNLVASAPRACQVPKVVGTLNEQVVEQETVKPAAGNARVELNLREFLKKLDSGEESIQTLNKWLSEK